ncbi:MAG TPA: acyl-[acyl-carrier-protein]--UDP-N-acetylglucosamine O-acyltransferase, partial [Xanthomonadales bacterium]|nr:acyl-[acyl-carrier-protein]--UDP-N-acetylglucosamine O-acyltransferase [Xanthomonadales bacterium]
MKAHETAIIDPAARIADDVEIGAYTLIGPQVSIGAGTRIGPHVVLKGRTTIGCNNH